MSKPVLLLDIDGVINCIRRSGSTKPPYHVWPKDDWVTFDAKFHGSDWPILYSRTVVDFLTALHDQDEAEIRWHTTWQGNALGLAVKLGLPVWPVQPCPEWGQPGGQVAATQMTNRKPGWWKYMAAERVLTDEGRDLIWVDDDISWQLTRLHRDRMRGLGPRVLLVSPDTYTGLTPGRLRLITEFLKGDPVDA